MTRAISPAGLALIQTYEGFRAEPSQMPDGAWLVGFGHVRIGDAGESLSEAAAADLLALDLAPVERLVSATIARPLTQGQFDALVSFAFSVGAETFAKSDVARRAKSGDFIAAACAMDAWRKSEASGELEIVDALVCRRAAEKAMFLSESPCEAAPSAFLRAKLDHAAAVLGAPVKYAPVPAMAPAPQPKDAGETIAEILASNPAAEALLLTQVVASEAEVECEIATAHAAPVARKVQSANDKFRALLRREPGALPEAPRFDRWARPSLAETGFSESLGLFALLAFGIALASLGALLLLGGGGPVEWVGGTALAAPGLAASLLAAFALRRARVKALRA